MLSDSLEVRALLIADNQLLTIISVIKAVRPQLLRYKTYEEAASAVDEMFNSVFAHGASGKIP